MVYVKSIINPSSTFRAFIAAIKSFGVNFWVGVSLWLIAYKENGKEILSFYVLITRHL